ncbi:hypothetical protein ACU81Q_02335 [Komagataeibacter melomenusus]|uniref:hypothetical protein n=1 Tax=Komagataeibacter melomenusus TaxID=2766578 RepID=UPI0027B99248|nr:hypothetical protein [Komagataeibacter melomenusus]
MAGHQPIELGIMAGKVDDMENDPFPCFRPVRGCPADMGDLAAESLKGIRSNFQQKIIQITVMIIEVSWRYLDFPCQATHRQIFQPFSFQYSTGGDP